MRSEYLRTLPTEIPDGLDGGVAIDAAPDAALFMPPAPWQPLMAPIAEALPARPGEVGSQAPAPAQPSPAQPATSAPQAPVQLVTNSVGDTGDAAMNAPLARATFNLTGAGIKIGIISDSFAINAAQAAQEEADGDLPSSVTVLADSTTGNDEGRAMAELVHQVAPGAQIYFSTAEGGEQTFANSIANLVAAGCTVIVDDVSYLAEPFYQTGNVIQTAVQNAINAGVSYFTAAGNESNNYYETTINMVQGTLPNGVSATLQNFGATASASSGSPTLQTLTINGGATVELSLQWTQPFKSSNGSGIGNGPGSAYSLGLELFNGSTLVASAVTNDVGSDPTQLLSYTNPSGSSANYTLAITLNGGTVSAGTLKYIVYGGATIDDSAAGQGSGSVIGHALVTGANTVGAAYAGTPSVAESYSSYGTGTFYYSASGTALNTPVSAGKVNFVAPDGIATSVSTSGFSFSSFFGTSAAAPDAASIGVLMQQLNPNLTPAEVTAAITDTTTAMSGPAAQVGAGFVNADAALQVAYGDAWSVASGGAWEDVSGWSTGAPDGATYVTLSDDFGALTGNYTVTVTSNSAAASTLTIGDSASITVALLVDQGATLTVSGGAAVGAAGSLAVDGSGELVVDGRLRITDPTAVVTVATGGTLVLAAGDTGNGFTLDAGSLLDLTATASSVLVGGFTSAISVASNGVEKIDLTGLTYASTFRESYAAGTLTIYTTANHRQTTKATLDFNAAQNLAAGDFTVTADGSGGTLVTVACFVRGTRIATPRGQVPVEALEIGDPVLTVEGRARPIHWIGRRCYAAEVTALEELVRPVRIRAGALAEGLPRRDLLLSPEHALLLDDEDGRVLVPARLLVNGVNVTRSTGGEDVDYFHIELRAHAAVLAEGQPAETFLDDNSRATFANFAEYEMLYPPEREPPVPWMPGETTGFCAPRVQDGPVLARIRERVALRAGAGPAHIAALLQRQRPEDARERAEMAAFLIGEIDRLRAPVSING